IASNCSSAARKSSAISAAMTSGSGRFAESSWASSLSQKTSRLTLSRLSNLSFSEACLRSSRLFSAFQLGLRQKRFSVRQTGALKQHDPDGYAASARTTAPTKRCGIQGGITRCRGALPADEEISGDVSEVVRGKASCSAE